MCREVPGAGSRLGCLKRRTECGPRKSDSTRGVSRRVQESIKGRKPFYVDRGTQRDFGLRAGKSRTDSRGRSQTHPATLSDSRRRKSRFVSGSRLRTPLLVGPLVPHPHRHPHLPVDATRTYRDPTPLVPLVTVVPGPTPNPTSTLGNTGRTLPGSPEKRFELMDRGVLLLSAGRPVNEGHCLGQ